MRIFLAVVLISCAIIALPSASLAVETYIASKNSDKYHKPGCPAAKKISNDNLISFTNKKDAEKAGYKACPGCVK